MRMQFLCSVKNISSPKNKVILDSWQKQAEKKLGTIFAITQTTMAKFSSISTKEAHNEHT